jgi:DNA-directed RNA polymerase subunit RPC12/RpoP
MSLQKGYLQKCPKCAKKGIHVDKDTGRARCKYCLSTFSWYDIKP